MKILMTSNLGDLRINDICTIIAIFAGTYQVRRASDGLIAQVSKRMMVDLFSAENYGKEKYCHFTFDLNSAVYDIPKPKEEYDSLTKSYFGIPQ